MNMIGQGLHVWPRTGNFRLLRVKPHIYQNHEKSHFVLLGRAGLVSEKMHQEFISTFCAHKTNWCSWKCIHCPGLFKKKAAFNTSKYFSSGYVELSHCRGIETISSDKWEIHLSVVKETAFRAETKNKVYGLNSLEQTKGTVTVPH